MATGSSVINPVVQLLSDVIEVINNNDDNPQTLQIDLRAVEILVQDLAALFRGQQQAPPEIVMFWLQLLQNSLSQVKRLLNRRLGRGQRFVDCVVCKPRRFSKEVTYWNSFFNHLYHAFQGDLSMLLTSLHFLATKPLYKEDATGSGRIRDAQRLSEDDDEDEEDEDEEEYVQALSEDEEEYATPLWIGDEGSGIGDAELLSEDDDWMRFRRVAFKDEHVSMDIEDRGRLIAAECKGMPLAINMVAAAMIGQRSVDEWDNCLSSIRSVADTSTFAATHPLLSSIEYAQLYKFFRWSYDALPNSNLKNCFLYSAMYQQDLENGNPIEPYGSGRFEGVDSRELVEMWIGEGLVKSQEGTHIMDMAIGRNYIKLLVQRCFFHIVRESINVRRRSGIHDVFPSIRVPEGIREMAMDIAQKEGKFLVMRSPDLRNLQEDQYENCRRISFADNSIGDLPTNFRWPNLASLILAGKTGLKELPSGFLLFMTSLTVLNLSGCSKITSIPTSVGQLRQLEFLSLSGLRITDLPPEISHLSKLQFLNLSWCASLESLPSQIGELKNLKHLNLCDCSSLKMIPREISQLTSLCRLQMQSTALSVEMEAPATIWSLKGLKNLTELAVWLDEESGIKDGIMGTWSEMRHLSLYYYYYDSEEDLPQDVQNMKKLQSLMLYWYRGLNLPNCKFAHLEMVRLYYCTNIRELTPLERLPNLKILKLYWCSELRELGIGSGGSVGYPRLQKLVLERLEKLESLCGASNRGVWDEGTLPHLRVLKIRTGCPSLKRFPSGMEKLQNLSALVCSKDQWESMMWEDDNMRVKLQNILKVETSL